MLWRRMNLPKYLLSLVLARHGLGNLKMLTVVLEMELVGLRVKTILPVQGLKKEIRLSLFIKFYPLI